VVPSPRKGVRDSGRPPSRSSRRVSGRPRSRHAADQDHVAVPASPRRALSARRSGSRRRNLSGGRLRPCSQPRPSSPVVPGGHGCGETVGTSRVARRRDRARQELVRVGRNRKRAALLKPTRAALRSAECRVVHRSGFRSEVPQVPHRARITNQVVTIPRRRRSRELDMRSRLATVPRIGRRSGRKAIAPSSVCTEARPLLGRDRL